MLVRCLSVGNYYGHPLQTCLLFLNKSQLLIGEFNEISKPNEKFQGTTPRTQNGCL